MSLELNRLSPAHVQHAKVGLHHDGGGLYLQVVQSKAKESGKLAKSWVFKYRSGKRVREMGLGSLKTISLKEAREEAARWRKVRQEGKDPIDTRKAERATKQVETAKTITFEECATAFMAAHEAGWRNAKHRAQWTSTLKTYAYPIIGKLPVSAVNTDHIVKILQPIWVDINETAARVRGRIEKILNWAKVQDYRTGDNPARWQGHLEFLLAKRSAVRKAQGQVESHHPALAWSEIPEFMTELRRQEGIAAKALEFTILTAARSGETRGLPWEGEIAGDVWIVPPARMKRDREHRVPLTGPALAVIQYMEQVRLNRWVFPGEGPDEPLSDMALTEVIRRMNQARAKAGKPLWVDPKQGNREVVPHGFRSSFRDWVDEDTAFADWLAEAALAHAKGDKVEAAYKRGDALAKRRKLMEAWAEYCAGTAAGEGTPKESASRIEPTLIQAAAE